MFSVLVIRLRSLRLLRVSGIVMRLRMFLLRSEERFSRNAETDLVCRLLLEKKKQKLADHPHSHLVRPWSGICDGEPASKQLAVPRGHTVPLPCDPRMT